MSSQSEFTEEKKTRTFYLFIGKLSLFEKSQLFIGQCKTDFRQASSFEPDRGEHVFFFEQWVELT